MRNLGGKKGTARNSIPTAIRNGALMLIVFGSFTVGMGVYFQVEARYATILYHYNAEYRAGNYAVENAIINKAIPEIIKMYYRHPKWNWSLEIQPWALVNMSSTNVTIFNMLRDMINSGQCEIISQLWSYDLVSAFTSDDANISLMITRHELKKLGINKFPRVCFFQESQTFPGFGNPMFKNLGFDTIMIGTHMLYLHDIEFKSSLLKVRLWNDPTTDFYYYAYNWVPDTVSDGFHFWTFLATGETVTGRNVLKTQGTGQGEEAYLPQPELIQSHEDHLARLHASGYKMMTISDYVSILEDRGEYTTLEDYVPETTWRDIPGLNINRDDSNGLFTWMGYNTKEGNDTHPGNDDGAQLSETFRNGNFLKAVKTLLEANWNNFTENQRNSLNESLQEAYKYYFKAQATDAYGWEPSWLGSPYENVHESDYSRINNAKARTIAREILKNISSILSLGNKIQVYTANMSLNAGFNAFSNETANWINETSVLSSLTIDNLPINVTVEAEGSNTTVTEQIYDCNLAGFTYKTLNISIPDITRLSIKLADA
ncbi:MAG: hypothetical protein ACTSVI_03730, partial [Promethearchaeota archaeon]